MGMTSERSGCSLFEDRHEDSRKLHADSKLTDCQIPNIPVSKVLGHAERPVHTRQMIQL
jgi:hypothetical protein